MPRVIFCPVEEAGILAQRWTLSTVKKIERGNYAGDCRGQSRKMVHSQAENFEL
jgi:hypothetical protein